MAMVREAVHKAIDAPLESVWVWITEVSSSEVFVGGEPLDEVRARRASVQEVASCSDPNSLSQMAEKSARDKW